ncbi:MAG: DUF935 family protein [Verrucomicrobiota bacterium]
MNPLTLQLVNRIREEHNPLRGLTIRKAVSLLERSQSGDYADLQWLYKFIEKRDSTLRAVKRRVLSSIKKLDWNIKVIDEIPQGKEKIAEEQKEKLRMAYERIENIRAVFGKLALAEFRGYSFLEKHWTKEEGKWHVHRLEHVPQWHWVRPDGDYGEWRINLDARAGIQKGEQVNLGNFVYREIEDPIDEVALFAYIRKNLSKKDWDGFIETYGIPWIFLVMPQEASGDEWEKYLPIAKAVMGDSRGVLPYGADVKTADANTRGTNPFESHARYQDEEIVLAGTGGLLTQLSKPTGIGEGASEEHADTFQAIAEEIAMDISECLQVHFDKPFLAGEFPDEDRLVYFELAARDEEDINDHFTRAKDAHQAGLRMDADELSEKTGYKLVASQSSIGEDADEEEAPLTNRAPIFNRSRIEEDLRSTSVDLMAEANREDLDDLFGLLDAIEKATDPDSLDEALKSLDRSLKNYRLDPTKMKIAEVLEGVLGTAAVSGAAEIQRENSTTEENEED